MVFFEDQFTRIVGVNWHSPDDPDPDPDPDPELVSKILKSITYLGYESVGEAYFSDSQENYIAEYPFLQNPVSLNEAESDFACFGVRPDYHHKYRSHRWQFTYLNTFSDDSTEEVQQIISADWFESVDYFYYGTLGFSNLVAHAREVPDESQISSGFVIRNFKTYVLFKNSCAEEGTYYEQETYDLLYDYRDEINNIGE